MKRLPTGRFHWKMQGEWQGGSEREQSEAGVLSEGSRAMIRVEKIILMTKLAIYDKYRGESDRKTNEYFRHDYIYRKNMWTRFTVVFGGLILLAFDWLYKIFVQDIDLSGIDIQQELKGAAIFLIAIMLLYTLIGTVKTTQEYNGGQERLRHYHFLLNKLDRMQTGDNEGLQSEEELNGRDLVYTRNRDSLY